MKTLFRRIFHSFYNRALYHEAAHQWDGLGLKFANSVAALLGLVMGIILILIMRSMATTYLPPVLEQFPDLRYENGKVETIKPGPYSVLLYEDPPLYAVFDTGGDQKNLDQLVDWMKTNNILAYVTSSSVMIYDPKKGELRVNELGGRISFLPSGLIGQKEWKDMASTILSIGYPLIFFGTILGMMIMFTIRVLLWGLVAWVMAKFMKAGYSYAESARVTAVAIVPYELISVVVGLITTPGYLMWVIMIGYLYFGIKSAKL